MGRKSRREMKLEKMRIKADVKKARISAKTEKKLAKQQARADKVASRQAARAVAFEHGIDPGAKWAKLGEAAVIAGGSVALGGIAGKTIQNVNAQNKSVDLMKSEDDGSYVHNKESKTMQDRFFGFINKQFDKEKVV